MKKRPVRLPSIFEIFLSLSLFFAIAFSFTVTFKLPLQIALFSAWFIFMFLGYWLGHSYDEMEKALLAGISQGLVAVIVLIAVGALVGSWLVSGIVPGVIYYGLHMLSPTIFLPACLMLCAMTSLATGTSWGTVGTMGIAMMGVGSSMGMPAPLVAGAILSGAYFGDKLSPMSDSVILAATLSKVDIFRAYTWYASNKSYEFFYLFSALFLWWGLSYSSAADLYRISNTINTLNQHFTINKFIFIPILTTIFLMAMKKPAFPTLCLGAGLGVIWGIALQDMSPLEAIRSLYKPTPMHTGNAFLDLLLNRGGISEMLNSVVIIFFWFRAWRSFRKN